MRRLTSVVGVLLLGVLFLVIDGGEVVQAGENPDTWLCVGADDPDEGVGHYDNVLEGWEVKSPDGQHLQWGEGEICTEVHTSVHPD